MFICSFLSSNDSPEKWPFRQKMALLPDGCDPDRMIQRVIGGRYPHTRRVWQSFQPNLGPRQLYSTTGGDGSFPPPPPQPTKRAVTPNDYLETTAQRVIDQRYPETRLAWLNTHEDPSFFNTTVQRSRSRRIGTLPSLNDSKAVRS
jgi:hypothetical protein